METQASVSVSVHYLQPHSKANVYNASQAGDAVAAKHGGEFDERNVILKNAGRPESVTWNLDVHGFQCFAHSSNVTNFMDAEELKSVYDLEVQRILRR